MNKLRNGKVDSILIFYRFFLQSHLKCRWCSILGQRCDFMELTHHSVKPVFAWPVWHVCGPFKHSDKLLTRHDWYFSIIPRVQWNMLWELHAELSSTLKPRPAKSHWLLILQLVCRVGLPGPQTFFSVCDSWLCATKCFFNIWWILLGIEEEVTKQF